MNPDSGNQQIVVASGNRGKLAEIRQLLAGLPVAVRPQSEFAIAPAAETGTTFRENALIKARHAAAAAGLPAIADDSGLSVTALDGRPGVHSARFAGQGATDEQNIDKLLAALSDVASESRLASFHCVAVYVAAADDPRPLIAEGVWQGRILRVRRGGHGFGYDPVFYDSRLGKTAAEMSAEEKNRVSHRGQAMRELSGLLAERLKPHADFA